METDKHYFTVGLFIVGIFVVAAIFAIWLEGAGHRNDVRYRILFEDSVSGLNVGDPVKYRGVDVGNVETIAIHKDDPRLVQVDIELRKETPVNTDTMASLRLKGITGVLFIELSGESATTESLLAATPEGQIPVIPAQASSLNAVLDQLPKTLKKIDGIADQITKALSDKNIAALSDMIGQLRLASHNANDLSESLKEDPSQLIWSKSKKKRAREED